VHSNGSTQTDLINCYYPRFHVCVHLHTSMALVTQLAVGIPESLISLNTNTSIRSNAYGYYRQMHGLAHGPQCGCPILSLKQMCGIRQKSMVLPVFYSDSLLTGLNFILLRSTLHIALTVSIDMVKTAGVYMLKDIQIISDLTRHQIT
jgi:hypothetical protein